MQARLSENPLHLRPREVLDIHDGEGLRVSCLRGDLWITQADDPQDVVLAAGESFVLDRPGLALVSSPVGASTLAVRPAVRAAPPAAFRRLRRAA
jgi:Protein of unknown function (DUF2917)